MKKVRCSYVSSGNHCPATPTEGRLVPLDERDEVTLLFCMRHALAYDAIEAAEIDRRSNDTQEKPCQRGRNTPPSS